MTDSYTAYRERTNAALRRKSFLNDPATEFIYSCHTRLDLIRKLLFSFRWCYWIGCRMCKYFSLNSSEQCINLLLHSKMLRNRLLNFFISSRPLVYERPVFQYQHDRSPRDTVHASVGQKPLYTLLLSEVAYPSFDTPKKMYSYRAATQSRPMAVQIVRKDRSRLGYRVM